ncbi:hypothetical protein BM221_007898 [Beauveria bassiana]|uniref:Uncharacterized protein n=1 Tax=Beauveria bassiana TaxID=176275 RepID=A0A2N6NEL9_BEABA|nr:hypothetical protein BM221_007898 [Beauveria bassiana]
MRISRAKPAGWHVVARAHCITTLQRPAAQRCQELVMQFHWPSSEQDEPADCCWRDSIWWLLLWLWS